MVIPFTPRSDADAPDTDVTPKIIASTDAVISLEFYRWGRLFATEMLQGQQGGVDKPSALAYLQLVK